MPAGMFVEAHNRRFDPDIFEQFVVEERLYQMRDMCQWCRLHWTIALHDLNVRFNDHQRLAKFDRLSVFDEYFEDAPRDVTFDFVHHFHGFDDTQAVTRLDGVAFVDKRWVLGGRRCIIGADHR